MKIGIVTIIDNNNYGNRLQNYALQQVLKKYGTVETIRNNPNDDQERYILRLKKYIFDYLHIIKLLFLGKLKIIRLHKFKEFNRNIYFSKKRFRNLSSKEYDYYVAGSDQIWNPSHGRLCKSDVLYNIDKGKCNSYAASFGVSEINGKDYINIIKKQICNFNKISVREESGKRLLSKFTDRKDVEVLVDPTMLLSAEDWEKISVKPDILKDNKYILCYFLGEMTDKEKDYISKLSIKENMEIINILDKKSPYFNCGPSEFLYLEKNASFIFTDSFHSCVFAIIFEIPFMVFDRISNSHSEQDNSKISMNSRIDTLLKKFKLQNRKFNNENDVPIKEFNGCERILEEEKSKAISFLNSIFKEGE